MESPEPHTVMLLLPPLLRPPPPSSPQHPWSCYVLPSPCSMGDGGRGGVLIPLPRSAAWVMGQGRGY